MLVTVTPLATFVLPKFIATCVLKVVPVTTKALLLIITSFTELRLSVIPASAPLFSNRLSSIVKLEVVGRAGAVTSLPVSVISEPAAVTLKTFFLKCNDSISLEPDALDKTNAVNPALIVKPANERWLDLISIKKECRVASAFRLTLYNRLSAVLFGVMS